VTPARGALIVLEGAEGVGKTTQLRRLGDRMMAAGVSVTRVREPGGTAVGDEIRRLLLDPATRLTPRAEALLFMASRAQLVDDVVRPAIADGRFVLADRYFLATYAYQVAGRGLEATGVRDANLFATSRLTPDLTLLLDLPDGHGLARVAERGDHDRIEQSGEAFHARVSQAFREFANPAWQEAHPECGPVYLVDARGTREEVEDRVWRVVGKRFPETFQVESESYT